METNAFIYTPLSLSSVCCERSSTHFWAALSVRNYEIIVVISNKSTWLTLREAPGLWSLWCYQPSCKISEPPALSRLLRSVELLNSRLDKNQKVSDGTEEEEWCSLAFIRLKTSPWKGLSGSNSFLTALTKPQRKKNQFYLMLKPWHRFWHNEKCKWINEFCKWKLNCNQIMCRPHFYFCSRIIRSEKPWKHKLEPEQMPVGGFRNKKMRSLHNWSLQTPRVP